MFLEERVSRTADETALRYPHDTAIAPDGRYVIVWSDLPPHSPGLVNFNLYAQRYNADGTEFGGRIAVATSSQFSETSPTVAMTSNGTFVVSWISELVTRDVAARDTDSRFALYAWDGDLIAARQVMWNDGIGDRLLESNPVIDTADDGSFVVASFGRREIAGQPLEGFWYRSFDAGGRPTSSASFLIPDLLHSVDRRNPRIAVRPDGRGFALAYEAIRTMTIVIDGRTIPILTHSVRFTTFDMEPSTGRTTRRHMGTISGPKEEMKPDIAVDAQLRVTVAYVEEQGIGTHAVKMKRFTWGGSLIGEDSQVSRLRSTPAAASTTERIGNGAPRVAAANDGSFAVTWTGDYDRLFGSRLGQDVYLREYDASGRRLTTQFRRGLDYEAANRRYLTGDQQAPEIAKRRDGFVISWTDSRDVFAAVFRDVEPLVYVKESTSRSVSWLVTADDEDIASAVVEAHDPDSTQLSLKTQFHSAAWYVDSRLQLDREVREFENWGGLGEKWLKSESGKWYFMNPQGDLYRWVDASRARLLVDSIYIASLGASIYAHPESLLSPSAQTRTGSVTERFISQGQFEKTWYVDVYQDRSRGDSELAVEFQVDDGSSGSSAVAVVLPMHRRAEHLDVEYQLTRPASFSRNWGGLDEKWISSRGGDWFYILPSGELMKWEGQTLSPENDTLIQKLSTRYYEEPSLIFDAELAHLDRQLNLQFDPDWLTDSEGRLRKWVRGTQDQWYYITSDGVLMSAGTEYGDNGSFVAVVGMDAYEFPLRLTEAQDIRAASIYELSRTDDKFTNWAGLGENWIRSESQGWFYVTPDRTLWKWDGGNRDAVPANSIALTRVSSHAASETDHLWRGSLAALDQGLNLAVSQTYATNWGGYNEKWLRDVDGTKWWFLLPNGRLYEWSGDTAQDVMADSEYLATVPTDTWDSPEMLHVAWEELLPLLP